jgi:hemolysin-activating ACP:hemolysin acyltransferase
MIHESEVCLPSNLAQLLADSPYHCDISEDGVRRLIEAPFRHNKAMVYEEGGKAQGLMTWAFLYPHQIDGYLNKTRKIKSIDFMRNTGDLWFIDFIAPYGNTRRVIRAFQKEFQTRYPDIKFGKMFRRAKGYDARVIVRTT